jgi:8-oxo-dGTP pyrophosphatase MutT (NUDIX family)
MQLPITIKIDEGTTINILNVANSNCSLKMRDGKVFTHSDKLYINLDGQTFEILSLKAVNTNGDEIEIDNIEFDTNVRVSGVIQFGRQILLIYRERKGRKYYTFPGGHIKSNESPTNGIIREIKEETNIVISDPTKIAEFDNGEFGHDIFFHINLAKFPKDLFVKNPEVPDNEVAELIWVTLSKATNLDNLYPTQIISHIKNM